MNFYANRKDAGRQLSRALRRFEGSDTVVLALPRGGIVLGAEVARELEAPLGLVLVRKLGHPDYPEYAIGAIVEGEAPIYNENEVAALDAVWLKHAEADARDLIERRKRLYYSKDLQPLNVSGKTVLVIDDGIATGLTMEAAVRSLLSKNVKSLVVATPTASRESVESLKALANEVVVLDNPDDFLGAIGAHYKEFNQVEDEEVAALLWEVNDEVRKTTSSGASSAESVSRRSVSKH